MTHNVRGDIETLVNRWRGYLAHRGLAEQDAAVAEEELRRAFSDEGWIPSSEPATPAETPSPSAIRMDFWIMLACAAAAAIAIKIPAALGVPIGGDTAGVYTRNISLFVLPFLTVYLAWKRRLDVRHIGVLALVFAAAAVMNAYPFNQWGSTQTLASLHLPVVLWLAVGIAFLGGEWRSSSRRMEFVRFTGEWLVTYALIALGGVVLILIATGVFEAIGTNIESVISEWVLPCGAMGAVLVAAWLADGRRNIVGGMAPMLARVFTPLFAILLAGSLAAVVSTRGVIRVEREVLIVFDVLLILVVALVLYVIAARDRLARPATLDWIQLVLVACALVVDLMVLANMAVRLNELGLSPNRAAALGLNIVLLVNLAWTAYLQARFVTSRDTQEPVVGWQTRYLPVYAAWAGIVVVIFPLVFRFA